MKRVSPGNRVLTSKVNRAAVTAPLRPRNAEMWTLPTAVASKPVIGGTSFAGDMFTGMTIVSVRPICDRMTPPGKRVLWMLI